MSLLDLSCTLDEKSSLDMDLLESNYYKLPFCDDDDMKSAFQPRWSDCGTSDDLCDPHQLPHSPSSTASSAAGGGAMTAIEHACSLMNERPDTPLMAIKFEDFSNGDYGLNDMGFPTFCDDLIPETYSAHGDEEIDVDDMTSTNPLEFVTRPPAAHRSELDCSLSSAAVSMGGRGGGATITISKGKDGAAHVNTCHRRASNNLHDQPVDFSFSKHQRVDATTTSATSSSSAGLKRKAPPMLIYDPSPKNHKVVVRKQVDSDFDLGDLISLPSASTAAAAAKKPTATSTPASCPLPGAKVVTNTFTHKAQIQIPTSTLQSILKNGKLVTTRLHDGQVVPNIRIKTEGGDSEQKYLKITQHSSLPPTPPGTSSSSSSDSDGSVSPHSRCGGNSPITRHIRVHPSLAASSSFTSQLLSSSQRLTQAHGPLVLTEEEKRTLIAEGYPVPSKLPLTKTEEKSLKKVRRKIKNKISAQESRRKKKEYVEKLEKRMDIYNKENMDLKRKLDSLENSNRSLLSQLRSLQTLVAGKIPKPSRTVTTQTSSCLMMLVLCFAVFLGGWFPTPSRSMSSSPAIFDSSSSSTWRSRILMTIEDQRPQKGNDILGGGMLCRAKDGLQCATSEGGGGGDTYERPKSRVNINDTGDQKIIRNTMEPRSAADVLAAAAHGRKVSDGVVVMTTSDTPTEMSRKIAAAVNRMLVKE